MGPYCHQGHVVGKGPVSCSVLSCGAECRVCRPARQSRVPQRPTPWTPVCLLLRPLARLCSVLPSLIHLLTRSPTHSAYVRPVLSAKHWVLRREHEALWTLRRVGTARAPPSHGWIFLFQLGNLMSGSFHLTKSLLV